LVSVARDPNKVRAGKIGAQKRWGETPRVIRVADLTAPQRRLVVALVAAARAELPESKSADVKQTAVGAHEADRGDLDDAA